MQGRRQPQRIPPPIDHGVERIDAELVLREFPSDLGLALWKTVRTVRSWSALPPGERASAFPSTAYAERMRLLGGVASDPELLADLDRLAEVLRHGDADPGEIAAACARVSAWADEKEAPASALEFIQAAALASPRDPALARIVGRIARERGEYARAETWYRQTVTLARQARDWQLFADGFLGLAVVYLARGNLPLARKCSIRALRVGKRHTLRMVVAHANHELMVTALRARPQEALRYARAALEAYGPGDPWLPALGHDLAVYWMLEGYFGPALEVFRRMPRDLGSPSQRLNSAANLARAAAGAGEMATYREGLELADRILADPRAQPRAADALLTLGRAALLSGDWDLADHFAERAARLARERGEGVAALQVEAVVEAIRAERLAGSAPKPVRDVPRAVEELAAELSAALAPLGGR